MVDHRDDDDLLHRTVDALRELPPLNPAAVSRIVTTAARMREVDADPHGDDLLVAPRSRSMRWPAVAAIAAAAAFMGYLVGGGWHRGRTADALVEVAPPAVVVGVASSDASPSPVVAASQASTLTADALPVPTQFVFDSRTAKRVALVGDFNGWDERAAPLDREAGSTLWSVTVPLLPGRHVYAFLVDSTWTTDPRAPKTSDPDFGVTGSVVIVGKP